MIPPERPLTCFKAYDIRGRLDTELDPAIARRIGRAFAEVTGARRVVVGRDSRDSSPALAQAVTAGLVSAGVTVFDLGLCGTEEMYFATTALDADGGLEITASHNPADWNGIKLVGRGSAPLGPAFAAIRARASAEGGSAEGGSAEDAGCPRGDGQVICARRARAAYVDRILSFVDIAALRPMTILVNAGNGAAGPAFDAIAAALAERGAPLRILRRHHRPDGRFPHGVPNPLLPENRPATAAAVRRAGADLGVAWDGDFDRCFLFDAAGRFVDGEHVMALLAEIFLQKCPGATIVHDARVTLNITEVIARAGGRAVQARTGHVFMKQALRDHDAVYGGEISAHHYFRDFVFCDSGMIPWLMVAELMSRRARPLADLVAAMRARFPSSGEISLAVADPEAAIARVEAALAPGAELRDTMDGLSLGFADWRFNLRRSNTEALLRLNVESRGDPARVAREAARIRGLIGA